MADGLSGDLGRKLREARERRGMTLRQVAEATRISVRALESLERNDISRLPGGIFTRAFVRAYAVEVGLTPEEMVQEFIAQFPDESVTAGHPTAKAHEDFEAIEGDRRAATTFLHLIAISIPIAGVVLYFATAGRKPQPPVRDAPLTAAPPTLASPAPVPPAASAPAQAASSPAQPGADVAATPAAATPDTSQRLAVTLSVSRACWISARADGVKVIQRTLQVGEHQTIEVNKEFVLTAGDAGAVTLTLNGAEAKPLGKSGQVVTVRMSPSNFRGYLPNP
jgi:cytoskeletal protein RodZ